MKITENSQKNVLIIGSGSMGYSDQRIHDMWIDKYNLFSKVEHESSIRKGKYKPLIILEGIDWCGTRTIYNYIVNGVHKSLPLEVFNDLGLYLWNHLFNVNTGRTPVHLFLRQSDPGLGICIPQDTRENFFSFREESDPLEKIYIDGLDK
nr:hypothetical protein [uncultured Mediterranean phage uvMED]